MIVPTKDLVKVVKSYSPNFLYSLCGQHQAYTLSMSNLLTVHNDDWGKDGVFWSVHYVLHMIAECTSSSAITSVSEYVIMF